MYCGIFIFVLGKIIYKDKNVRIPKVMQILCTQYTQMYRLQILLHIWKNRNPYDSIASLILTFLGTPLEFPLTME